MRNIIRCCIICSSVFVALLLTACASNEGNTTAQATTAQANEDKSDIICSRESVVGSHFKKTVCFKPGELERVGADELGIYEAPGAATGDIRP